MNPDIKKRWIDALRSGEYKQTIGTLRRGDCFCAFGVLCDLYAKDKKIEWGARISQTGRFRFLGMNDFIPDIVLDWAECGLNGNNINPGNHTRRISYATKIDKVAALNDKEGKSFKQIADYIQAEL